MIILRGRLFRRETRADMCYAFKERKGERITRRALILFVFNQQGKASLASREARLPLFLFFVKNKYHGFIEGKPAKD